MAKHVIPRACKIGAVGFQIIQGARSRDALEFAFLAQDIEKDSGRGPRFGVAVEIDDIIKIARPGTLGERPDFLGKGFFIGICRDVNAIFRRIAIRVIDRQANRGERQMFVGCQVQLDVGNVLTAWGDRAR